MDFEDDLFRPTLQVKIAHAGLKHFMKGNRIEGFVQVVAGESLVASMSYLIQGSGLGALRHNTVVVGWPDSWRARGTERRFLATLNDCAGGGLATVVPKNLEMFPEASARLTGTIDLYWILMDGGLLLLLAFLLQKDAVWAKCEPTALQTPAHTFRSCVSRAC